MSINLGPGTLETSERSRQSITAVAGGSIAQAAAAGAAAVLAIIGLAGTRTDLMMSIATIALGAAFLLREGGLVSQSLRMGAGRIGDFREPAFGNGLTAATIAGITGVALGILALVDVDPWILVPAAVIVFGGGLLLDNGVGNSMALSSYLQRGDALGVAGGSAMTGGGGELLVGVGAAALGILALIGIAPLTLSLVALLALGVSTFLVGSAMGTKLMTSTR
jgi:hypothetical protein